MNRKLFYSQMSGEGTLDYELYLNTKTLLSCQSKYEDLCNADELQFQIVHQVEELWMKLIAYTLLDIDDYLQQHNTNRVLTLFRRVHTTATHDDQSNRVARNHVAQGIPGDPRTPRQRQRPGISRLPHAPEDVSADLEFIQRKLLGQAQPDARENLRLRIQPRRRIRRRRISRRVRRTLPKIPLRAHAADSSHDRLRRQSL